MNEWKGILRCVLCDFAYHIDLGVHLVQIQTYCCKADYATDML